jgi:hypothetical protein
MKNWTDKIIHWGQLPGTEVKRLIDTWGMTPEQIAKYDKKHGYTSSAPAAPAPKAEVKKAPAKKVAVKAPVRQRHTGADGEVKFVEHRNLYVGFFGGRVVVTKRTKEQCLEVLRKDYNLEV